MRLLLYYQDSPKLLKTATTPECYSYTVFSILGIISFCQKAMALDFSALDRKSRSNTWPLPDPAQLVGLESGEGAPISVKREPGTPGCESPPIPQTSKSEPKKMRNAWGNMSYAELITQAILSSPEKKLTLSEIYEWIVRNVPYFADKASSPSTAGWKVR